MFNKILFFSLIIIISISCSAALCDDCCDILEDLIGYTIITTSNVSGTFEGSDYDKLVKLDNGMIFEFNSYNYHYAYRPKVIIFAKQLNMKGLKPINVYKLIIDDDLYDVTKIR